MKAAVINRSALNSLGSWSAEKAIAVAEECQRRGVSINDDSPEVAQAAADISWSEKTAQKQRVLPLPSRN